MKPIKKKINSNALTFQEKEDAAFAKLIKEGVTGERVR